MPTRFQRRVLAGRTRALASRGAAPADATLPPHLVCLAGGRHLALPVGMVASVRPFGCVPVPLVRGRAAGIVLGLALIGRRLASVLELARLLGGTDAAEHGPPAGGSMLLLRGIEPPVAVRVDAVLGVLRLRPAADPGRALLPEAASVARTRTGTGTGADAGADAGVDIGIAAETGTGNAADDAPPPLAVLLDPAALAEAVALLADA